MPRFVFDHADVREVGRISKRTVLYAYSQTGHMGAGLACTAADLLALHAMPCRPTKSLRNACIPGWSKKRWDDGTDDGTPGGRYATGAMGNLRNAKVRKVICEITCEKCVRKIGKMRKIRLCEIGV